MDTQNYKLTVSAGDTLGNIAERYQIPLSQLVDENHIADPNCIEKGSDLYIFTDDQHFETYTVKSGDAAYKIAQNFGISYDNLCAINPELAATMRSTLPAPTLSRKLPA